MPESKLLFGIVAIVFTVIGYVPYIRDVVNGKTRPHICSWLLFAVITLTAFALQLRGDAGLGSFATLTSSLLILTVVTVSLIKKRITSVSALDRIFVVLTLISLGLWLIAKQPVWSAVLITVTDILAYGPTIRKSWSNPYSETPAFFIICALRYILILFSLETYSVVTALYPLGELIMLSGIATILFWKRRKRYLPTNQRFPLQVLSK